MDYSALIQKALEIVIEVLLPVLLGMLVLWLKKKYELVKAQIPAEQWQFASELAYTLVLAAEQNGLTGMIKDDANAKKEWALGKLDSELQKKGIRLDLDTLSDMIESAVHEAFKMG